MTEDEKARHDSEYESLLALYLALLKSLGGDGADEAFYELAELRVQHTVGYVLEGLGVDVDYAIQLIRNKDDANLTFQDKELKKRIIAALDNLINFSVCEEYQLYNETLEMFDEEGDEDVDEQEGDNENLEHEGLDFDIDDYEEYLLLCEKYNDTYAAVENADIKYSGIIAAWWLTMSAADWVTYWTQNDAKVRPWHMSLQGYTAPRDEFPSWMIPPIEYNCRCFLQSYEPGMLMGKISAIKANAAEIKKPAKLSDVYSESLAKCGRIFGPSHNYFTVKESDKEFLSGIVERLRQKYYG